MGVDCRLHWTCPVVSLRFWDLEGDLVLESSGGDDYVSFPWNAHGLNLFRTTITFPPDSTSSSSSGLPSYRNEISDVEIEITYSGASSGVDLIVDDFFMEPLQ